MKPLPAGFFAGLVVAFLFFGSIASAQGALRPQQATLRLQQATPSTQPQATQSTPTQPQATPLQEPEQPQQAAPAVPRERKAWEGIWSLYGASLATHQENGVSSYAVGVELSDVRIQSNQLWFGYFADLRYSDLARGVDLTIGAEAGASVVGADAGLYVRLGRNPAVGFRARGCLSALVVISICAGGGYTNRGPFFEGSVLLKYGRRRARSDPDADAEAREQDESAPIEIAGAVSDEGVFVEDAELEERVHPAEPDREPEGPSRPNDGSAAGDIGSVQIEATADVLEADPGADPDLVEPAEVDAVHERNIEPEAGSSRSLAGDGAAGQRDAE